jgi:hypothetical protein
MVVYSNRVVYTCLVHYTAQYYKLSMAYLDEIFSDHMKLRPMFVCVIHIYENDYELATVVAYFYILVCNIIVL